MLPCVKIVSESYCQYSLLLMVSEAVKDAAVTLERAESPREGQGAESGSMATARVTAR